MSEDIEVHIKSNTDSLSADAVHDSFAEMIKGVAEDGTEFLRGIVPHGETLALSMAVGHHGPDDDGFEIRAEIGIPMIMNQSSIFNPASMKYPIYVDEGTGIFGHHGSPIFAYRSKYMKLPPDGIHSIYQHEVKGQKGRHFMAATYAAIQLVMLPYWKEKWEALLKARLTISKIE